MANTRAEDCNRQNPISFVADYDLADFVDNSNTIKIALPVGAVIQRGSVTLLNNANTTGTDVLDVGYTGALEAYKADINLKGTDGTVTALVPTGYKHLATTSDLILTRAAADTAATAMEIRVEFTYVVMGKGDLTQD